MKVGSQTKLILGIFSIIVSFSIAVYIILQINFGPPPWLSLDMPLSGFLLFLWFNLAFGAISIISYVIFYTNRDRDEYRKKRLRWQFSLVFPIIMLSVTDFLMMLQAGSFRRGASIFSNYVFLALWLTLLALTITLLLEASTGKVVDTDVQAIKRSLRKRTLVAVYATLVLLISASIVTYSAMPYLANQHIVPNGQSDYFALNGGYGDTFLTITRSGTLQVNVSSTANMTVYVLNSSEFSALVNLTSLQSYPPPIDFEVSDFLYSSGTVHSANFNLHLAPGFYAVVYFNRGPVGTTITINSMVYTPVRN